MFVHEAPYSVVGVQVPPSENGTRQSYSPWVTPSEVNHDGYSLVVRKEVMLWDEGFSSDPYLERRACVQVVHPISFGSPS